MRAKKSVPEKHAGNELNEEKHMCFATYKKRHTKLQNSELSELNKIDTNLCVNSKVQILEFCALKLKLSRCKEALLCPPFGLSELSSPRIEINADTSNDV